MTVKTAKAEREDADAGAMYEPLFHRAGESRFILNADCIILDANRTAFQTYGYQESEVIGMPVAHFRAPLQKHKLDEDLGDAKRHRHGMYETVHMHKDGTPLPVEVLLHSMQVHGEVFYYAIVERAQPRRTSTERRITADACYRRAFETTSAGILILEYETGKILDLNPYLVALLGYRHQHYLGAALWETAPFKHAGFGAQDWARLQQQGYIQHDRLPLQTRQGRQLDIGFAASVFLIGDQKVVQCNLHDITEQLKPWKELELKNSILHTQQETSPDGILLVDRHGKIISYNQPFARLWRISDELLKQGQDGPVSEHVGAQVADPAAFRKRVAQLYAHEQEKSHEEIALKDGRIIDRYSAPVTDAGGIYYGRVWHFRDITERKRAEESMRLASLIYENSSEAMSVTDAEGRIITVNPAFTRLTGYALEELVGKNHRILSSGRHDKSFYQRMWQEINTTGHWQGEIWNKRKNGETYVEWLTINTIYNEDDTVQRRVALFSDITQKKQLDELMWKQANFDALTGLPNRHMFLDRLELEIKKAQRAKLPLALIFLDLDHFKDVNDTLGHAMGDILLQEAASRLRSCVRGTDIVARLGGDEFTIILGELEDSGCVERIAQSILSKLAEPFRLGDETAFVSASLGITFYPEDAATSEALLINADQAMYAAKSEGRNRYNYFTPTMQQAIQARMRLANDLRSALPNGQFQVLYQPIVELATGKICKAEALLRWQHPTRGVISPAEFIPIAEETGLIGEIGDWVFGAAVRQAARWRERDAQFQISVNKSPLQFRGRKGRPDAWSFYLREHGLPGQNIVVEITESLLMDASPDVIAKLLAFRDAGVQVSLDDFGTGYSSLAYLKKFHIDYLKIDQSFVQNLMPGSDDLALCEAMIVMAHKLGLKVIAEGVESARQRDLLLAVGCDYGQGFLFSKPMSAQEFDKLL